jgi:hypothetical protein
MLNHRQNSRAFHCRRCGGSGEAQSRERVSFIKIILYIGRHIALKVVSK